MISITSRSYLMECPTMTVVAGSSTLHMCFLTSLKVGASSISMLLIPWIHTSRFSFRHSPCSSNWLINVSRMISPLSLTIDTLQGAFKFYSMSASYSVSSETNCVVLPYSPPTGFRYFSHSRSLEVMSFGTTRFNSCL